MWLVECTLELENVTPCPSANGFLRSKFLHILTRNLSVKNIKYVVENHWYNKYQDFIYVKVFVRERNVSRHGSMPHKNS